jgi:hypothetical protein
MSGDKYHLSTAKGKVGVVIITHSRAKAAIRTVTVILEVKEIGHLQTSYLICINRKVLGQVNKSQTQVIKADRHSLSVNSQN